MSGESAFREGLRRAEAARRAGGNAISLDDRKPKGPIAVSDAVIDLSCGLTSPLH